MSDPLGIAAASDIGNQSPLPTPNQSAAPDGSAPPPPPASSASPQPAPPSPKPVPGPKPADPALLALVHGALGDICTAMDDAFAARSLAPQLSRDRAFANGVFHKQSGVTLAVSGGRTPLLAVTLQDGIDGLLQSFAASQADAPEPGDVYLFNDPFLGSTHATDLRMATPVFRNGALVAWVGNACRWPSLGGGAPGGIAPDAVDHGSEGLRIPPVQLFRRGEVERGLLTVLLGNVPDAERRMVDILAQASALSVGVERLEAMLARFGMEGFDLATGLLFDRADLRAKRRLALLPEGSWQAETVLDGDGVGKDALRLSVTLTRKGNDLIADFAGSSPPCRGPLNCPPALVRGAARLALHGLFPDLPMEGGSWRSLRVPDPVGTFLHAVPPRPVSAASALVVPRIVEAIFSAIGQILPDQMPARSGYGGLEMALNGHDPGLPADDDGPGVAAGAYAARLAVGAGRGARAGADGNTPLAPPYGPTAFGSVEALERSAPVALTHLRLRQGGGGAGTQTGGDGLTFGLQLLRGAARAAISADLAMDGPSGRSGGRLGTSGRVEIHRSGRPAMPSRSGKEADLMLTAGDSVLAETPGGGGFGPPRGRPVPNVVVDMVCGRVRVDVARSLYGVAIEAETGQLDEATTAQLRSESGESAPQADK